MKKIKNLLTQIERAKKIIALERDKLRLAYLELESLLDDLDSGIDSFEIGKKEIEEGLDTISQKL